MTDHRIADLVAAHDEVELAEMLLRLQDEIATVGAWLHPRVLATDEDTALTEARRIVSAALAEVER